MIVTAFGDVKWGDRRSLFSWLAAHDIKHQSLAQALVNAQKIPSPSFLLADTINDKWTLDHYFVHTSLANAFLPTSDSTVYWLQENPMTDEETFYGWMDTHDQVHSWLDQVLGVVES